MTEDRENFEAPCILVIEDEIHIAITLKMCLEKEGHRVVIALDGVEGLEKAFAERPALILLDLRMPKMDGHLVIRALREDERTRCIPVIVLSAIASEEEKDRALEEGAQEYLVKPFSPQDLVAVVSQYLPETPK